MPGHFFHINRNMLVKITAVIITLFFVVILLTQVSFGDIITTLYRINPLVLIAGFILYVGCYIFRSLRFSYLLRKEIPAGELFSVVCLHNLITMVLPAKTGELSYIYLVNKHHGRTIGEGVATLLIARIFDVISISLLFLASFVIVLHSITANMALVSWVVLVLGVFILLLFLFLYKSRSFLEVIRKICFSAGIEKAQPVIWVVGKTEDTVAALENAGTTKAYTFFTIFLLSLGVWGCYYAFAVILVLAMNFPAGVSAIVFACTFAIMTTILPVQGIGNFGTFEAGWTVGFISIGIPAEMAVSAGFSFHLINISFSLLLGLVGFILLRREIPRLTDKCG